MEVLGIPGVKIVPDNPGLIKGGTFTKDGKVEKKDSMELELSWDPDNAYGNSTDENLIDKNLAKLEAAEMEAEQKQQEAAHKQARAELEQYRASRVQPQLGDFPKLLEYLRETEINELEFEIVRCRPLISAEFMEFLKGASDDTEDAEDKEQLQGLQKAIGEFVAFTDANLEALSAPTDRLKKLLTAKDKRAMIADMGGNNEIDTALLALLQTNINTARQAGQADAAEFMQKVFNACQKFAPV